MTDDHTKRRPMTGSARKRNSSSPGTLPRKNGRRHPSPPLTVSRPELLVHGSDRHFRRLVHSFFGFLSRHEAIRRGHAARIGLLGVEYSTLISIRHLDAEEGDVNVNRVAEHLHLSGAFVTNITNKLLKRGLIHKSIDPADRRRVKLQVSEKGDALLAELAPVQRQVNDAEFGCLSQAEFLQLLGLVERLIVSSEDAVRLQAYLSNNPAVKIIAHPRLPSSRRA
jgi:MarR family transcriptional regulator, organic hydroperoxide resistance regulator